MTRARGAPSVTGMPARFAACLVALFCLAGGLPARARPNIVWIIIDDMSANFSCYGETLIRTPHLDRMAVEGTRFSRAFVTAPVCSPCRSALITGMYQTSIGSHHHRSGRGVEKIRLPDGVVPIPALFRKAGYYTCIGGPPGGGKAQGKTDYNFEWDRAIYDGTDWVGRAAGQPFFMQVQLPGGKLREGRSFAERVRRELGDPTDPSKVLLPPYYPRDPVLLEDWARYLDAVRVTDLEIGRVIDRLRSEGLLESTVVFAMTDHGISHARGKQFLTDEGIHVPLVIRGPGFEAGKARADFVEHIDLAPTSLALAGIEVPAVLQGRSLLADTGRSAVFSARDRCDETVERLRAVRTERFKYVRNGYPKRPHLQPNRYKDAKPIVRRLRELHGEGKLDALQEKLLFASERPAEELYDLAADPHETRNLAADPDFAKIRDDLRAQLEAWQVRTNDRGRDPEPAAMYDSDMAVYLEGQKGESGEGLRRNIELMKRWAAEGR